MRSPLWHVPAVIYFVTTDSELQGQVAMDCRPQELIDLRKTISGEEGVIGFLSGVTRATSLESIIYLFCSGHQDLWERRGAVSLISPSLHKGLSIGGLWQGSHAESQLLCFKGDGLWELVFRV